MQRVEDFDQRRVGHRYAVWSQADGGAVRVVQGALHFVVFALQDGEEAPVVCEGGEEGAGDLAEGGSEVGVEGVDEVEEGEGE